MTKEEKRKIQRKKYNDSKKGKDQRKKYNESKKGKEVLQASKKKYNESIEGKEKKKRQGERFRASEKGVKYYKEYSQLETTKARQRKRVNKFYKTEEGRVEVLFQNAKQRAKKNGRDFSITREWIREKLKKGVCEATGTLFSYRKEGHNKAPFAPSLDRKNSKLGYTKRNTQLICSFYNILKWNWDKKTVTKILNILKLI